MATEIENILNREMLREFLEKESGQPISDAELDGFLAFISYAKMNSKQQNNNYNSSYNSYLTELVIVRPARSSNNNNNYKKTTIPKVGADTNNNNNNNKHDKCGCKQVMLAFLMIVHAGVIGMAVYLNETYMVKGKKL